MGLFYVVKKTDWGEGLINKAFDLYIVIDAERTGHGRTVGRSSDSIVFADMDDESSAMTKRDDLAEVINAAYRGGAKIIALDILLEDKDCCTPENDVSLEQLFRDIAERTAGARIIFPVRTGRDGEIIGNRFAGLIEKYPDRFYSAMPNIVGNSSDRVIRYFEPYRLVQDSGGAMVMWNMAVLAAVMDSGQMASLGEIEEQIKSGTLTREQFIPLRNGKKIIISPDEDDIYLNRIRYSLIPEDPDTGRGNITSVYKFEDIRNNAYHFKDKIVIIGNSAPEAGDIHSTPVGNMAGMYIIGNTINTVHLGKQPRHSHLIDLIIELLAVIMAAYLFLYLHSLLAALSGSLILIFIFLFFGYFYFRYTGVFLNIVFPLAGLSFHRIFADIEEVIETKGIKEDLE